MRKIISLSLAIMLLCTALTACNPKGIQQTNKSLTIYTFEFAGVSEELKDLFRSKYPHVELNIVEFKDIYEYRAKLSTAVMAGEGPDLYIFSSADMMEFDIQKQIKAGAFEDIAPFLEADVDYVQEEYNQKVIDFCKTDGKQYLMPLEYGMGILLASKSKEDYIGLENLMSSFNNFDTEYLFSDSQSFTDYYLFENMEIVNDANETVTIDTPEFRKLAKLYQGIYQEETRSRGENGSYLPPDATTQGKSTYTFNHGFAFGQLFSKIKAMNTKGTTYMCPIINKNGGITSQLIFSGAISSHSTNKQNAYNMLRLKFDLDVNVKISPIVSPWSIPIKTSVIDDYYRHPDRLIMVESRAGYTLIKPLDEKPLEQLKGHIERIDSLKMYSPWQNMLHEELVPYYQGKIDLDEAIANVQSKLKIYISE